MDIPYEKQFHFRDGTSIGTLEELKRKIESVSYQEFYHHVNAGKNDFAAWIRHVIKEERLATELERVTSIVETVEIINDFLHPRPVETPRLDAQSRIEQSIFSTTMPAENGEQLAIEQVPTITPLSGETAKGTAEVIIEEPQEEPQGKVREELFGTKGAAEEQPREQPREQPSHADDMSRMIIKDFMYGLVFGLIVGLILGRMISF